MAVPQPSLYEQARLAQITRYPGLISDDATAAACFVSAAALPQPAHDALRASLEARGYAARDLTYITLCAHGEHDAATATPAELYALLEALDPLCVVLTDHASVEAASAGYNVPLPLETRAQLLGRACRCFEDFSALIATEAGKRRAWAALKGLPTFPGR